jgi:hypothetical protein
MLQNLEEMICSESSHFIIAPSFLNALSLFCREIELSRTAHEFANFDDLLNDVKDQFAFDGEMMVSNQIMPCQLLLTRVVD